MLAKYEDPISYGSKVKVKVKVDNLQTDTDKDNIPLNHLIEGHRTELLTTLHLSWNLIQHTCDFHMTCK